MANQPLILADNLADGVVLHPGALLTAGATWGLADAQLATAGHEPWRVADNLRDLTWWTPNDGGSLPHLAFPNNTSGGSGGMMLSGTGGSIVNASTSQTFIFLCNRTVTGTGLEVLSYYRVDGTHYIRPCASIGANGHVGLMIDSITYDLGAALPSDGAWHSLTFTCDGGTSHLNAYLDGVAFGTANVAYTPRTLDNSGGFSVYGQASGGTTSSNVIGRWGRALVYSAALDPVTIQTIHAAIIAGNAAPASAAKLAEWDPGTTSGAQSAGPGTQRVAELVSGNYLKLGVVDQTIEPAFDPLWGAYYLLLDSGSSVASDTICLDRGHNLRGAVVWLDVSDDPTFGTYTRLGPYTIPAVAGGLPTDATGCLTAEGVWWKTHASTTGRYRRLTIPTRGIGTVPIVTGWCVGASYRLPAYLDAPAAVDYRTKVVHGTTARSRGGVLVKSRPINYAELDLRLQVDGSDYAALDAQVRPLLRYNQPWWFCLDDSNSTLAGLLRPFWLPGDATYDPVANPYHREVRLTLEEVVPALVL